MTTILYTTLITLFYYLAIIFAANKIILKKYTYTTDDNFKSPSVQMLFALNINIICTLFITHDSIINYMTFLIGDDTTLFKVISSGTVFMLAYVLLLFVSYAISNLMHGIILKNSPSFLKAILWITIHLIILKLTQLYYEAYINSASITIF